MLLPESFSVRSYKGKYEVVFTADSRGAFANELAKESILVIDRNVHRLHGERLGINNFPKRISFDAFEKNKDLKEVPRLVSEILQKGVTKKTRLVVVGGGITQDMGAFCSSIIFRGIEWVFFPTTLLAQADSCIGSKTSINVGDNKNQVGNFTPPSRVVIDPEFLDTLVAQDIHSGYGEIMKVHLIDGQLERIEDTYHPSFTDKRLRMSLIERSLKIKRSFIEQDEFDMGVRNLLNYGHTFGHALESATDFRLPHGLAVVVGMDIANHISTEKGLLSKDLFYRIRSLLKQNFPKESLSQDLFSKFIQALRTDKKNSQGKLTAILSRGPGKMEKVELFFDEVMQMLQTYEET